MTYVVERIINEHGDKQFLADLVPNRNFKNRVPIWRDEAERATFETEHAANAAKTAADKGDTENLANMRKHAGLNYPMLATRVVAI